MHVLIVSSDRSFHHGILDHVIMSDRKYIMIFVREARYSEAVWGANAFPKRLASSELAVLFCFGFFFCVFVRIFVPAVPSENILASDQK